LSLIGPRHQRLLDLVGSYSSVAAPIKGDRSMHWIKVKNRKHPAMSRVWNNPDAMLMLKSGIGGANGKGKG
jgi:hypothetical protein